MFYIEKIWITQLSAVHMYVSIQMYYIERFQYLQIIIYFIKLIIL
jgi:hypothetical protein